MNTLEQTLIDIIQEQQIKLGYVKETVRLYFPEASLKSILGLEETVNTKEMESHLQTTIDQMGEHFGEVHFKSKAGRYALVIPPMGCAYVHDYVQPNPFLTELIGLFRKHHVTLEQVKALFAKYDADFICEAEDGIEFDYLLYFKNKRIDSYYYCLKFDVGHGSYHRFSENDISGILGRTIKNK